MNQKEPTKQQDLQGFLSHEEGLMDLENLKEKIAGSTKQLDEQLEKKEINGIEHCVLMNEQFDGMDQEEIIKSIDEDIEREKQDEEAPKIKHKRKTSKRNTAITLTAAAIVLIALIIIGIFYTNPGSLTGLTVGEREIQEVIDYNALFEHYTETQLGFENLTSLSISGTLEGTGAVVKLRMGDTEYIVANIDNNEQADNLITGFAIEEQEPEYTISTNKEEYAIGETVYITIEPAAENKSLYVSYGEETEKLEGDIYITQDVGEHKVIALIVLPDDILRLETNFTVINESVNATINESINETVNVSVNESTNESTEEPYTTAYEFTNLCIDTCNLPEISNPVLIVELDPDSKLTITEIIITQNKDNHAPEQVKTIPDIAITTSQAAALNLDEYFTDPDGDLVAYDINEIPEITVEKNLDVIRISSDQEGIYTAYIYATDGDVLVTSNTFEITVIETNATLNETINITGETNQTGNESTNLTEEEVLPPVQIEGTCAHPNPNKRPPECLEGNEEQYFKDSSLYLRNLDRVDIARITAFGNMVIEGVLIENSGSSPGSRDFKISYPLADGEDFITTAWIETDTGNMHLRGNLYEEQFSLAPDGKDTFLVQNRKGTNLGYFDRRTGDLYLRGNMIQNREGIE